MSVDADEVVVGADGRVYVAPDGTAVVDDLDALPSDWHDCGYISEDGVTFKNGQDVEDIGAWQSFYPIRKIVTGKATGVEFVLRQWNSLTLPLAFGGGSVVDDAGGTLKIYQPPAPGAIDNRAMVIDWEDGGSNFRLVLPRGLVTGETETNLVRTGAADLPIAFDVTPSGAPDTLGDPPTVSQLKTLPWYLITNAPQFTT